MAKPPRKRRGITLNPHADSATSLDLLNSQPVASASEADEGKSGTLPETTAELLDQLRHMTADVDMRWKRQAEESQKQLRQLGQQRDQLAGQLRELQALERNRKSSRRLGVLTVLLTLAGVAALGFHTWPELRDVAGEWRRVSTEVAQIDPDLQAVSGRLEALTSEMGQVGRSVVSLREDISGVSSDLGSLRQVVNRLPKNQGAKGSGGVGLYRATHSVPRTATTRSIPYRAMRRPMPW